jgi:hypothetical protein
MLTARRRVLPHRGFRIASKSWRPIWQEVCQCDVAGRRAAAGSRGAGEEIEHPAIAFRGPAGRPQRAATFDPRRTTCCGRPPAAVTALVTVPGDTANRRSVPDALGVPPCLGAGQASRLTVRPFAAP